MEINPLQEKMNKLKCPKHAKMLQFIDLSKVSQNNLRILCDNCEITDECVTKKNFNDICLEIINQDNSELIKMNQQFTQIFEQIDKILKNFKNKIMEKIVRFAKQIQDQKDIEKQIQDDKLTTTIKEFEKLASTVANFKSSNMYNDQMIAESNQYLDQAQKLLQYFENLFIQNNLNQQLLNNQNGINQVKIDEPQHYNEFLQSEKLNSLPHSLSITSLELNFDESILVVRSIETHNTLKFWVLNQESQKWNYISEIQCYDKNLTDSCLSRLENSIVTSGCDEKVYSIKFWRFYLHNNSIKYDCRQIYKGAKRIQCVMFNNIQTLILAGEGVGLAIFSTNYKGSYYQNQIKPLSSETITTISSSTNDNIFGVGTYNSSVYILSYMEEKLEVLQKIALIGIPKRIIFGINNAELFILIKDGILTVYRNENHRQQYMEIQRIVNHIDKIRAIEFNHHFQILAIGGETNVLQLWKKNDNMQWKCKNQFQQDDFIDSICFSNNRKLVFSSNNNDIFTHKFEEKQ